MQKSKWRDKIIALARHRFAVPWLCVVSFTESIAQPIPPDLMLAPMSAAQPKKWIYFATWCTIASALGGVGGWLLGYYAFDAISPWLERIPGWIDAYPKVATQLQTWGAVFVFISGFSPLPYKFFTFTAGALMVPLPLFIIASLVGRGLRFYLVAWFTQRAAGLLSSTKTKTTSPLD